MNAAGKGRRKRKERGGHEVTVGHVGQAEGQAGADAQPVGPAQVVVLAPQVLHLEQRRLSGGAGREELLAEGVELGGRELPRAPHVLQHLVQPAHLTTRTNAPPHHRTTAYAHQYWRRQSCVGRGHTTTMGGTHAPGLLEASLGHAQGQVSHLPEPLLGARRLG